MECSPIGSIPPRGARAAIDEAPSPGGPGTRKGDCGGASWATGGRGRFRSGARPGVTPVSTGAGTPSVRAGRVARGAGGRQARALTRRRHPVPAPGPRVAHPPRDRAGQPAPGPGSRAASGLVRRQRPTRPRPLSPDAVDARRHARLFHIAQPRARSRSRTQGADRPGPGTTRRDDENPQGIRHLGEKPRSRPALVALFSRCSRAPSAPQRRLRAPLAEPRTLERTHARPKRDIPP